MTRSTHYGTVLLVLLQIGSTACASTTAPGGAPSGDLDVEFRNFTGFVASMGETGKPTVVVAGSGVDGNPTGYAVVNPGLGNTVEFSAAWNGSTLTATCTVSDITGISVPPGVIIQPLGFLDCSGW